MNVPKEVSKRLGPRSFRKKGVTNLKTNLLYKLSPSTLMTSSPTKGAHNFKQALHGPRQAQIPSAVLTLIASHTSGRLTRRGECLGRYEACTDDLGKQTNTSWVGFRNRCLGTEKPSTSNLSPDYPTSQTRSLNSSTLNPKMSSNMLPNIMKQKLYLDPRTVLLDLHPPMILWDFPRLNEYGTPKDQLWGRGLATWLRVGNGEYRDGCLPMSMQGSPAYQNQEHAACRNAGQNCLCLRIRKRSWITPAQTKRAGE